MFSYYLPVVVSVLWCWSVPVIDIGKKILYAACSIGGVALFLLIKANQWHMKNLTVQV